MIISKTPLRISLVGGGTDVPAFYEKNPGTVVSFAITKYVYVMVNEKFDGKVRVSYSKTENVESVDFIQHDIIRECLKHAGLTGGLEIVTIADIPGGGTGLGSSSALAVGLLSCLHRLEMARRDFNDSPSPNWLAETAFDVEARSCRKPVGKQDHYAAALGGFNRVDFGRKHVKYLEVKSRWDADEAWNQNDLKDFMLLLWTGMVRSSTDILSEQKNGFESGRNQEHGIELQKMAELFHMHMLDGKVREAANVISQAWEVKKKLSKFVTNDWIDTWYSKAMGNGAWGGKLCGAGGGGFLFFFAPPDTHKRIVKATGLRKVDFQIENSGSKIIYG